MSQPELLKRVVDELERAGVDYMLTGSLASSYYGEPRATHDLDIVTSIAPAAVARLCGTFTPPDYYLDEGAAREAVRNCGMFNLIDVRSGDKVDFWLLTDSPFDRSRFARRTRAEVVGSHLCLSTAEDTVLAKLHWAQQAGGSEKQFYDALRVYEVQFRSLEPDYLEHWAHILNVAPLWERLKREACPVDID